MKIFWATNIFFRTSIVLYAFSSVQIKDYMEMPFIYRYNAALNFNLNGLKNISTKFAFE